MQAPVSIIITCDSLVQFEEDAASFAQNEPEFVNGAVGPVTGESASTNSSSGPLTSDQPPGT